MVLNVNGICRQRLSFVYFCFCLPSAAFSSQLSRQILVDKKGWKQGCWSLIQQDLCGLWPQTHGYGNHWRLSTVVFVKDGWIMVTRSHQPEASIKIMYRYPALVLFVSHINPDQVSDFFFFCLIGGSQLQPLQNFDKTNHF